MKMLDALDLQLNELRNFVVQVLSADPANTEARVYYNSVSHTLRYYNGTVWSDLAAATYTDEQAQDAIAAAFAAGTNTVVTVTYNDAANSFSLTIGAGQVTLAMLANIAANTVLANTSGSAAAPSATTLSAFKTWLALAAADISNFDTQVRTSRLDQMAAPTADVSLNSHKLTNVTDGTATTDAATWGQVQALVNGLDFGHPPVRAVATANVASLSGTTTIDGVSLVAGDRVLLTAQSTGSANGAYVVAAGAWSRVTDFDTSAEVAPGAVFVVTEGTSFADTLWVLTTNAPITLGTTSLTFVDLPTPNQLTVTAPLVRTGNALSLDITSTTHVARIWSGALTGGATSEVITHNLGTRDVIVQVLNNASPWDAVMVTWEATSTNTVTIRGGANLPASYRVVVTG